MNDDVKMPPMDAAMLTALTPSLQPTGQHKTLPDGYCPDCCGAPCIRTWLPKVCPACGNDRSHDWWTVGDDSYACDLAPQTTADAVGVLDEAVK